MQFFHSAAMKVNYELYRDERSGQPYNVPEGNDIDVFRAYIETLAAQESPEIFGLHPNADLTFRTLQVRRKLLYWGQAHASSSIGMLWATWVSLAGGLHADSFQRQPPGAGNCC